MEPNDTHTLELKPSQVEWLEEMADKHGLPDASKALRCLINYGIEEPDQEGAIFQEIRCRNC